LVERARVAGLAAVALTDHDTVSGVAAARAAASQTGIEVIAGVELSALENDGEVHILGLHLTAVESLEPALEKLREARVRRAVTMLQLLNALGVPVTMDELMAQAGSGAIGRPHVARALIACGWAKDERDAFDRFLGAGRPAYVAKQRLTIADAVRMVHDAGGVAVLAHPGRQGTLDRLKALRTAGLDGVEVRHPSHSAEDEARLGAIADALSLLPSGGSDWHGAMDGPRVLGAVSVPAEWAERQALQARRRQQSGSGAWNSPSASHS
jgi:predicted metal-dependent phosphoesterase TrpH